MNADILDRMVRVDVAKDAMSAVLRLEAGIPPETLEDVAILASVRARGVTGDPDMEANVRETLRLYRQAPDAALDHVIAKGVRPQHGVDGSVELDPATTAPEPTAGDPPTAEADHVDHYSRTAIHPVRKGQTIGRVTLPVPGVDGRDVHGKRLAAKDGHPAPLRADATIEQRPDGSLVAQADGVVDWRPPLLRIRTHLVISGSVDFSTGNVDFPGDITVEGGVRDCFRVRCRRDLIVQHTVEASDVEGGRDVRLQGGIAGRDKGSVVSGRDLHTKYLSNVPAAVGRDLLVESEVVNSHVSVGRQFRGRNCSITGGVLIVGQEVDVEVLGSEAGVATDLVLGRLDELEALRQRIRLLRPLVEARCEKAEGRLRQLQTGGAKLSHSQAEQLTEAEFELASCRGKLDPLDDRAAAIERVVREHTRVHLTVGKRIHAGVKLWIPGGTVEFSADVVGPLRITTDERGDPQLTDLIRKTTRPLNEVARVLRYDEYEGPNMRLKPVVSAQAA